MDKRSLVAIALCIIFYLAYSNYLSKKYPNHGRQAPKAGEEAPANGPAAVPPVLAPPPPATNAAPATTAVLPPEQLKIETDTSSYDFSPVTGSLARITLKNYKTSHDPGAEPIDLLGGPFIFQGVTDVKGLQPVAGSFSAERQGRTLRFWRESGDFRVAQEFRIPEQGYGADIRVTFTNISGKAAELTGGTLTYASIAPKHGPTVLGIIPGTVAQRDQIIYEADGSVDWLDIEKFCKDDKDPPKFDGVPVRYAGIDRHYFLAVALPKAKTGSLRIAHGPNSPAGCPLSILNYDRQGLVQPGETVALDYSAYFGPKDLALMKGHDPVLEGAMHLGTFGFIARPLLLVIEGFQKVVHNFGVAIILLTICLKILFYPLVRASSVSMHKMKKLNPEMQAIRDKYKDDRQRQQQELMKFMAQNKINPMRGCLPILPQIPVFFAFYQVLQTSIQLRHAAFFGWITDLSAMDPYFVTPLLMGVAMFVQQRLTPNTGMDKTQEKILMFMPVMFTVMMLTLPAGLTLYMLTNTVVGIAQQKWLYRKLDKLKA